MKRKTLFLMVSLLLTISGLIAQTYEQQQQIIQNYDLEALSRLESEYASEFTQEKQRALELAAIYGWEEFKDLPNGGIAGIGGSIPKWESKIFCNTQ